jgi:hypothetical protein
MKNKQASVSKCGCCRIASFSQTAAQCHYSHLWNYVCTQSAHLFIFIIKCNPYSESEDCVMNIYKATHHKGSAPCTFSQVNSNNAASQQPILPPSPPAFLVPTSTFAPPSTLPSKLAQGPKLSCFQEILCSALGISEFFHTSLKPFRVTRNQDSIAGVAMGTWTVWDSDHSRGKRFFLLLIHPD